MHAPDDLALGLYERLVSRALAHRLDGLGDAAVVGELDPAEAHGVVARHVAALAARALRDLPEAERARAQVEIANTILDDLRRASPRSFDGDDEALVDPPRVLQEILGPPNPDGARPRRARPTIPLSSSALLVNGRGEPGVGSEVNRELGSADGVDLLVPFVRWTGVRIVRDALAEVVRRGGRVRVIASTYLGSSESRALEALGDLGAEVRVSYDTTSTRLHAKAWLFERASGYSTALIGSSNLSNTALVDGLEWNVRLSAVETAAVLEQFRATFETYWESEHVEPYEAERFAAAIERAGPERVDDPLSPFDLVPYPHQQRILERLEVERERHGRWRNLVVAATGTGKTVVAALDYRRLASAARRRHEPAVRGPPKGDPRAESPRLPSRAPRRRLRRGLRRWPAARAGGATCSRRCSRSRRSTSPTSRPTASTW